MSLASTKIHLELSTHENVTSEPVIIVGMLQSDLYFIAGIV